jgi:hypothetical protein
MENFKNIITLLNNPDTLELGSTLSVSQGLSEKIIALYELKQSRQNYKRRSFFKKNKDYSLPKFFLKKSMAKRRKDKHFSQTRNSFTDIIIQLNESIFISNSLND